MLFPHSVAEISRFLRATRISLILIDMCDITFKPFLAQEILDNTGDEDFFKGNLSPNVHLDKTLLVSSYIILSLDT